MLRIHPALPALSIGGCLSSSCRDKKVRQSRLSHTYLSLDPDFPQYSYKTLQDSLLPIGQLSLTSIPLPVRGGTPLMSLSTTLASELRLDSDMTGDRGALVFVPWNGTVVSKSSMGENIMAPVHNVLTLYQGSGKSWLAFPMCR